MIARPCVVCVKVSLPAAAHVGAGAAGLLGRLARPLAPGQRPLGHAQDEDERREGGDEDEAGARDDLVVRLSPQALATVVRERRGRRRGEERERQEQAGNRAPHPPGSIPGRAPGAAYHGAVAVVQASDLAKDMAGEPLLRGVSFRLERRERLTLAGRNGSGKTTLLRTLAGETGVDGGQLTFAKDVRVALHDQRPPRDRDLSLRDYVLQGCGDLLALEERLAGLEHAMADGATDGATLDAYARAQARLEHAGGYTWREGVNATLHGLGFRDEHLDRDLSTFSGGELTRASLARALAGDQIGRAHV